MPPVYFSVQSYQVHSLPVSAQRLVNGFLERQPQEMEAKSQTPVYGIPGMVDFADAILRPVRGLFVMDNLLFAVAGDSFYSVSVAGVVTKHGSGIGGVQPVSMAENGTQICIVNGISGFIYNRFTEAFNEITSPAFYPANTVNFFDGYFVFDRKDTNQFFISGLLDGNSYNGLDFASAEASARHVVGITQNLQLLFIFSQDHYEIWYDAGTADFPFQRYTGGVIWRGCGAALSIIKQEQTIFFLGNDGIFYRIQWNAPVRVSTHAIELIIEEEQPDLTNIHCSIETLEGHRFIHVTLPTSLHTLTYDTTTEMWHERESWDRYGTNLQRWRQNVAVDVYGKTMYGDFYDGVISTREWDVFTERGNIIRFLACSKSFDKDRVRVFCSRLELDMETGVEASDPVCLDPQVMLRYSKDGGKTWSQIQPWRSLGRVGAYLQRVRWLRLGVAYSWVFEVTITDPVKRVLIAANADFESGMELEGMGST